MASAKKENGSTRPDFNIKDFLLEGMKEEEFTTIGGLRPIATPDLTEVAPVAGWLIAELEMPPRLSLDREKRAQGIKEPWSAFLIEVTKATKAQRGEEIIDVLPGQELIIPLNGSLDNNRDARLYAADPRSVHFVVVYIDGVVEFKDGRNAMKNYVVKHNDKTSKPREAHAKYQLRSPISRRAPQLQAPMSYDGEVIGKDGKPVQSLVG